MGENERSVKATRRTRLGKGIGHLLRVRTSSKELPSKGKKGQENKTQTDVAGLDDGYGKEWDP